MERETCFGSHCKWLIITILYVFICVLSSAWWYEQHHSYYIWEPEDYNIYHYRTLSINLLTPNDPYMGRTAPLTSKRWILYIYSTNVGTEYFKHALNSPFFFPLQNAVCFVMLTCLVPVLFTFYIQSVLKLKK